MSARASIPFTYTHPQTPLRLLELPPDLLPLLTTPSGSAQITLKSRPLPATANPSDPSYNAVLCTPARTYTVRQVHSSNSTFIVRPNDTGVTAASTVGSVLELLPTAPDVKALIMPRLGVYTGWEEEGDVEMGEEGEGVTREGLLAETPCSTGEFGAAWIELGAFEHAGRVWRASAGVGLKALKTVCVGVVAEGVDLSKRVSLAQISAAVEEEGVPVGLVESVMRRISEEEEGEGEGLRVVREKCVRFAGGALLEDWWEQGRRKGGKVNDMMYMGFMSRWKAAVPDFCVGDCKVEVLKGLYTLPTQNTIRYTPPEDVSAGGTSLPIRNKWHEEFRKH